jgi:serine protease
MSRPRRRGTTLAVCPLEARDVPALADPTQLVVDQSAYDSAHVLVKWNDGLAHRTFGRGAQALGNGLYRVNLPSALSVDQAVAALRVRSGVAIAQPDYRVEIARTPDDPSFGSLWGLDNTGQGGGTPSADIGAPVAWNTSTGTGHTIVAVIDTGVDYNHPDLAANMWRNSREIPGNGIDDDHNGYKDDVYGYDFANNDSNPMDDNGHGTHVSGTIGALGNNGIGVAGVDWHAKIMALKFLDSSGSGYLSNAVRALNYAVANGAKVVNASFGGGGYDAAMATAIANARAHGVIVVAAAGNDSANNDTTPSYPANYPGDNLISVAATDRNDQLAYFSNYGRTTVDIAAPGQSIYSTLPGGRYGTYSGTSMATPHVTGAIALVWDAHPTWTYQQVIAAVLNTADRISSLTGKVATGRLDVGKAITYGQTTPTPPPTPTPTPTPTPGDTTPPTVTGVAFGGTGTAISRARVTFSEAINTSTFTAADVTLTGPSGNTIPVSGVSAVAGTSNQFDVTFAAQSAPGTYTLGVGPAINDLAGNPMARRATASTVVSSARTFASTDVGQTIWDFDRVASAITVTQDIAISDLNVTVNVSHTYDSDLRMWLVGPDGTVVPLVNRRGGSGDNFTNTTFDDEAGQGVWQGVAPFAGSYRPEGALSAFDGKSARGTWYLVVEDNALFDTGRLNGWSLSFPGAVAGGATVRQADPPSPANSWVGPSNSGSTNWQGTAPFFYC